MEPKRGWTRGMALGWAFVTVGTLSSCGASLGPGVAFLHDLDRAYARWVQTRPATYQYAVSRMCFCIQASTGPVRMTVSGEQVLSRVYVEDGEPVPEAYGGAFPTVLGLFDILRDAIEREADEIRVTYDPDTGAPTDIWIDYETQAADEELGFTIVEAPTPVG